MTITLLVLAGGFLSGFINTLASSGSAVTLPLLIFLGLPANIANGTNRISILAGSIAAIIALHRAKVIDWKNGLRIAVPVSIGVFIGSKRLGSYGFEGCFGRYIFIRRFAED